MFRGVSRLRQALAAFALLALCVRALVPAGYMVGGLDASGRQAFVTLCSENGLIQIAIDLETGAVKETGATHADNASKHPPCVFAGAATIAAPDLLTLPVSEQVEIAAPLAAHVFARPGLGLAAPPPPAIGPPLFI
jgi:hypothetical protein